MAASLFLIFDLEDYEAWKELFDSDPVGRKAVANSHQIYRGVDNPGEVFLGVQYPSVDDAKTFRQKLLDAGVLDRFPPKLGPTVVELAEEVTY